MVVCFLDSLIKAYPIGCCQGMLSSNLKNLFEIDGRKAAPIPQKRSRGLVPARWTRDRPYVYPEASPGGE